MNKPAYRGNSFAPRLSREEIAIQILCTLITNTDPHGEFVTENEVRYAFRCAELFERVSDEVGGRPWRDFGRGLGYVDDDDD